MTDMRRIRHAARGFTLAELAVAMVLAMVVAALAVPQIRNSTELSSDAEVKASLNAAMGAVTAAYGLTGSIQPLVEYAPGQFRPNEPAVESTSIRANAPDILVTNDGTSASTWYRQVSVATRWMGNGSYWRVGFAALGTAKDEAWDTADCWMAWRDIDPKSGFAEQNPSLGVTLEKYFLLEDLPPALASGCTGQEATYATSPQAGPDDDVTAGSSWNNPARLTALPHITP